MKIMKNVVATVARVPAYNAQGLRVAPLSERDLFMLERRAAGATWTEAFRAWQREAARRPHFRWLTANEVADVQERSDIAADYASMAP